MADRQSIHDQHRHIAPRPALTRAPERHSHRVVDIHEFRLQTKRLCQVRGQSLYAVSLGRVMPGRNVGHAGFAREMGGLFRDLARHIEFGTGIDRLLEHSLGSAGTPGDATDLATTIAHQ